MKRLLIITALLALLLPVQAVGTDAKKQYSSPRRYPAEIECAINCDIQKADSLVKAGKPDEALTFYKKSLKSKDCYTILLPPRKWKRYSLFTIWTSSRCKKSKGAICSTKSAYPYPLSSFLHCCFSTSTYTGAGNACKKMKRK